MKRMIALLLAFGMLTMLCACNSGDTTEDTTPPDRKSVV